jgi:large subunit ribosomal protein L7/L12
MSDETAEKVDLSKDAEKVLEMVEKLSVLDLANLVTAMEDKFGVSAAAPVAMAAAPAGGDGGGEAAAKEAYNIELKEAGSQKIAVIKVVREITQVGLKEAKELVDAAPKVIKENVKTEEAEAFKKQLEEAGATVELV